MKGDEEIKNEINFAGKNVADVNRAYKENESMKLKYATECCAKYMAKTIKDIQGFVLKLPYDKLECNGVSYSKQELVKKLDSVEGINKNNLIDFLIKWSSK